MNRDITIGCILPDYLSEVVLVVEGVVVHSNLLMKFCGADNVDEILEPYSAVSHIVLFVEMQLLLHEIAIIEFVNQVELQRLIRWIDFKHLFGG